MEIAKGIEELRKEKERKFDQTLDLIINLKNIDLRKEAVNAFLKVPNSAGAKVAGFLTKKSKLVDTITKEDFSKYKEEKEIKKLANKYDFFIAAAPLMGEIASKFGRVFGPLNKMPSPQAGIMPVDNDEAIKAMIDKMQKLVRVKTKELSVKIPVGKWSMDDKALAENVSSVVKELEAKLPRKNDNIKNVMIKFTMTKPVKVEY